MPVKITYFVHGTTTDNEKHLATGQQHGELSELGKRQNEELRETLKGRKFDVVYSSDLKRAVESAETVFPGREVKQDSRLRECDYGDLTGGEWKSHERILSHQEEPFPNGESYDDVTSRMREFIAYLKENHDGERVAIMCHHAPQLSFEIIVNNKNFKQAVAEDWRNTKSWQPGWEYEV